MIKCPRCGSVKFWRYVSLDKNKVKHIRLMCIRCKKTLAISSHICKECMVLVENRENYCKKCELKVKKDGKCYENQKEIRRQVFCKMTGMSRDRYFELKEMMGIGENQK